MDEGLQNIKSAYLCIHCGEDLGFKARKSCIDEMSKSGRDARAKENAGITARLNTLKVERKWIYATA